MRRVWVSAKRDVHRVRGPRVHVRRDRASPAAGQPLAMATASMRLRTSSTSKGEDWGGIHVQGVAAGAFLVSPRQRHYAGTKPMTTTEEAFLVERNVEETGPTMTTWANPGQRYGDDEGWSWSEIRRRSTLGRSPGRRRVVNVSFPCDGKEGACR